jgi:hypothetical protein
MLFYVHLKRAYPFKIIITKPFFRIFDEFQKMDGAEPVEFLKDVIALGLFECYETFATFVGLDPISTKEHKVFRFIETYINKCYAHSETIMCFSRFSAALFAF